VTVSHVSASTHVVGSGSRRTADAHVQGSFEKFRVGQRLDMSVMQQLKEQQYLVSMAGGQHVVDSMVALEVGARVRAVVVAVGERLELKYVASDQSPSEVHESASGAEEDASSPTLLAGLQSRYKITLSPEQQEFLERAVGRAADPTSMALSGLFLAKGGNPIAEQGLQAIYAVQRDDVAPSKAAGAAVEVSKLITATASGDNTASSDFAELLAGALHEAPAAMPPLGVGNGNTSSEQSGADDGGELARWLLNIQDDGSVAYRYGTLPVMVAGQLVELDLVLFQQRPSQGAATQIRRLVMTLDTQSFGPLQVEARALDNRLAITFTGQSPQAAGDLASYSGEVRQLATRLGWNVEAVGYEYGRTGRAARQIIDHVLAAGTVDLEF
jgi:hypothetical protein